MEKMTVRGLLEESGVEKEVAYKVYEIDGEGFGNLLYVTWYLPEAFGGNEMFVRNFEDGKSAVFVRITDKDELIDALHMRISELIGEVDELDSELVGD